MQSFLKLQLTNNYSAYYYFSAVKQASFCAASSYCYQSRMCVSDAFLVRETGKIDNNRQPVDYFQRLLAHSLNLASCSG